MAEWYNSPFGNGILVGSGGNVVSNVHNNFGPRTLGDTMGVNKVEGIKEELIYYFTGQMFNDLSGPLMPYVLPKGAVITAVYMDVEEAFTLTGTTPAIEVGTQGTEVTNGFTISEAQLEATNTVSLTSALSGTWDNEAPLAADTQIGVALSGSDTPTISNAGRARITILFNRTERAPSPAEFP